MKLRIARKMDLHANHTARGFKRCQKDKRKWNLVYTDEQLRRAEVRVHKSWRRACPLHPVPEYDGKLARDLTPDFFVGNRVRNRRERQAALRKMKAVRPAR